MIMTTTAKNIFGEHIESVNKSDFKQRRRVLAKLTCDLLKQHNALSGYFEVMLMQMSSETKMILFLKLARYLENQPKDIQDELEVLFASGKLPDVFEIARANWTQQMLLTNSLPKEINSSNIFGDKFQSIDAVTLKARIDALSKLLLDAIIKHAPLSAYFQAMLEQMSSEAKTVLFLKFSRWLQNQSNHFNAELDTLLASGKLPDVFEAALANWAQEMIITIAARKSRSREVYATQLFPTLSGISVPLGVIHQESHHANHTDMVYVCGMASAVNAKRIFEFGTYRGQTTCGLATLCKDAQIYTLNLAPDHDPRYAPYIGMYIAKSPDRDRITQIYHDSRTFDTTPYRESMDYIFIDGDHSYEGVKNDTEKALQLLKPGGVIVWHDYAAKSPGVLDYLAEFSQERPLFRLRKTCLAVYVDGVNPEKAQLVPMDISLEAQEYE